MTKIKYGCETAFATCLVTEVTPNPQSSLVNEQCIDQEQFNEDVYGQLEAIQTNSDLTELIEQCLDYVLVGGKLFVKNALLKQGEEICALKEEIEILKTTAICATSIQDCNFTFGDLVDSCGDQPQTLGDLLQILINQHITP